MISITRNTEEELVSIVRGIKAGLTANHAFVLHIRGSALGNTIFLQLPHLLEKWIGDPSGKILVCEDHDVFVFSSQITQKFYARFRDMVHGELGYEPAADNTVTALYDCSTHLPALEALIKEKHDAKQERLAREEDKRRAAALNAQANQELISTLERRRNKRKGIHALIIEDDPFSRRMVSIALMPGLEITQAETGIAGIREYLAVAPDIVFLDINLPDLSGLEILKKIKQFDVNACVVILSGQGSTDNVKKAMDAGAKGFVAKPFARDKLQQYLQKCPKYGTKEKEG
ncbi:MAG: response regulator [Alphaproteobacteria bacterium]|nr:response regulator [Alphaproteobacteria bacterium]